jgi:hypothetical protein
MILFVGSLLAMVMSLTQHFASEKEIRPIFQFLSSCDDPIVNIELAQLLLCLLVEGNYYVYIYIYILYLENIHIYLCIYIYINMCIYFLNICIYI